MTSQDDLAEIRAALSEGVPYTPDFAMVQKLYMMAVSQVISNRPLPTDQVRERCQSIYTACLEAERVFSQSLERSDRDG